MTAQIQNKPTTPALKVTQARVLRSEWTKMWSLRSTWITLAVAGLFAVGLGTVAAITLGNAEPGSRPGPVADAVNVSLSGLTIAQFAVGVLGVLLMAGEYSTGMIRATLAAVPKRLPMLWAKAVAFGGVAFAIGIGITVLAFLVAQPFLPAALSANLTDSGVFGSLVGASFYLAVIATLGVGIGALVRSTPAAIGILVGALLVVPGLIGLLPTSIADAVTPYLLNYAGTAVMSTTQQDGMLSMVGGVAVLCCYAAVVMGGAALRLKRQDV